MLILDAHVHIYDCYCLENVLFCASANISPPHAAGDNTAIGLCLTERPECSFFRQAATGGISVPEGWKITPLVDNWTHCFSQTKADSPELYCFAGRQINTKERIEIAGLFFDEIIADGQPATDIIDTILSAGGLPVLNWAFGKWLFKRGKLIRELVETYGNKLLLCDSAIRPGGWPAPRVYQTARKNGIPILCGTDPLPAAGEEKLIGSYHSILEGNFDCSTPAASLKLLLTNETTAIPGGKRGSWLQVLQRQQQYYSRG